jgi:DNA-binding transcriptional regulator YiaG
MHSLYAEKLDILAHVNELCERFSLAKGQFTYKIGVAKSTMSNWQNRRRATKPFLVQGLLELKQEADGKRKR